MSKLKILLIGQGKWSQNYQRTLQQFPNIHLTIAGRDNWRTEVNKKPDGVIICTPPDSHVQITLYVLQNNLPVIIEKPLALSLNECQKLQGFDAPILINHIHLFAQDYQHIRSTISPNQITLIDSIGTGALPERNYSTLWDYGPHDLAMILDLAQQMPINIKCQRMSDSLIYLIELQFGKFKANVVVGKTDIKRRYFRVNEMIYDANNSADHPLTNALQVFIDAIQGQQDYRLGLDLSLKVMRVLETCNNLALGKE